MLWECPGPDGPFLMCREDVGHTPSVQTHLGCWVASARVSPTDDGPHCWCCGDLGEEQGLDLWHSCKWTGNSPPDPASPLGPSQGTQEAWLAFPTCVEEISPLWKFLLG